MIRSRDIKPPILLIGNVRSGTTMIQSLVSRHPALTSWFEPRTVWAYADPRRPHDRFTEKDASAGVIRYIHRRFRRYQKVHDGLQIVEKTPSNVLRIPYVHKIFPQSKIIYIVRHPLDQISSSELEWQTPISAGKLWSRLKETPKSQLHHYLPRFAADQIRKKILRKDYVSVWGVRYPGIYEDLKDRPITETIAQQWLECVRQADEDLSRLPTETWILVRYEDVLRRPVEQFCRIFHHLQVEMETSLRNDIEAGIRTNARDKWMRMEPESLRRCLTVLRDFMPKYGYSLPTESDIQAIDSRRRIEAQEDASSTSHGRLGV